jgi:hypothetical protein
LIAATIVIVALAALLGGCATEQAAYDEATATNTIESYKAFLEAYPDGTNRSEAQRKLDDLEWVAVEAEGTAAAYSRYLDLYPDGKHAEPASTEAPKLGWNEAQTVGSVEAYKAFLEIYGSSAYAKKAKDEIALLELVPQHLTLGETKLEVVEADKKWIVTTEVENAGEVDVIESNFRIIWLGQDGQVVKRRTWLLVAEPKAGIDAPKELTEPIKPGKTRTFSFDFTRKDCSDSWVADGEHIQIGVDSLKLAQ